MNIYVESKMIQHTGPHISKAIFLFEVPPDSFLTSLADPSLNK